MLMRLRVLTVALAATLPAQAQEADPQAGRDFFQTYCWQCHGKSGAGTGPMAEMLAIAPPDLTTLSDRNGGTFPTERTLMQIDGRSPLLAHGGDMPIFGAFLEADQNVPLKVESGQPVLVSPELANLISYLQSLQGD